MLDDFRVDNFDNIVFSDEKTHRSDENHRAYVYRPRRMRFDERYVLKDRQSGRVTTSYWGWISVAGPGEIVPTGPRFNALAYMNMLDGIGLLSIEAQFGGLDDLIFQQDNAK